MGMGGVDLHDNAVANYRVAARSKKWYWPLWLSSLESAAVNAWKLHCMMARVAGKRTPPQKSFRQSIITTLILEDDKEDPEERPADDDGDDMPNAETFVPNLRRIDANHVSVNHPTKKEMRCKQCGKNTYKICQKCRVHVHSTASCFLAYHKMPK